MTEPLAGVQERTFARATKTTLAAYPAERRLSGEQLDQYLRRRAFAVIGSGRADGRPHAAISAFAHQGTTFWLPTATGSVRERNVAGQPWVTLVITHGDRGEHVVVIVEGPATIVPRDEVPADARAQARGDWAGRWLRVEAERLLSYAAEEAAL
jgi:nitroimidazol reductase NimA-like FMN-containing flavoprotein (pyridoxamine 5'-phosphate oxidase superfamily)